MAMVTELATAPPDNAYAALPGEGCPYKRALPLHGQSNFVWHSTDAPVAGPSCLADIMKGAAIPGDTGNPPTQMPEWLDMARCLKVNQFFEKHTFNITMCWHFSLVIGFALPNLLSALVFTGDSDTAEKSIKRYMRTGAALGYWHTGNIWDPKSQAWSSLQSVRTIHHGVREAMTKSLPDTVWLSMADMSIVQSGFMGAASLFPEKMGIHATTAELADYAYFWRCVGHQLGIDDKYNLCTLGNPTSKNIVKEVMDQLVMPDIANPPKEYHPIAQAYIDGLNLLFLTIPVFTLPSSLAIAFWGQGYAWGPLSFMDTIRFYGLRLLLLLFSYLPFYGRLLNHATRASFRQFARVAPPASDGGMSCPFGGAMAARSGLPAHVIASMRNGNDVSLLEGGGCPFGGARAVQMQQGKKSNIPTLSPIGVAILATMLVVVLLMSVAVYYLSTVGVPFLFRHGPAMWWGMLHGIYGLYEGVPQHAHVGNSDA